MEKLHSVTPNGQSKHPRIAIFGLHSKLNNRQGFGSEIMTSQKTDMPGTWYSGSACARLEVGWQLLQFANLAPSSGRIVMDAARRNGRVVSVQSCCIDVDMSRGEGLEAMLR